METEVITVGRIVFGLFFAIAGFRNFARFKERTSMQTNYGFPLPPPLLAAGFATQLVSGLFLVFGIWVLPAALALIGFLALATPLFHNFLLFAEKERDLHFYLVLVNITLAGGLLLVIGSA
jgi:putative oxidoreductase